MKFNSKKDIFKAFIRHEINVYAAIKVLVKLDMSVTEAQDLVETWRS